MNTNNSTKINQFSHDADTVNRSLKSLAKIKPGEETTYIDDKMKFVSRGIFDIGSEYPIKTLMGVTAIQTKLAKTLAAALDILRDDTVDSKTKDQLLERKISPIVKQLKQAEIGLKNLREATQKIHNGSIEFPESIRDASVEPLQLLLLHKEFKTEHCAKSPVTIDQGTGYTVCTIDQFKQATKLLRQNFPDKTTSPDKKLEAAQFLRVILAGSEMLGKDPPKTDCCFIMRELKVSESKPQPVDYQGSMAMNHLLTIKKRQAKTTEAEHLQQNLTETVSLFQKDNLLRSGNSFKHGNTLIPINGLKDQSLNFLKEVNEAYTKYLTEHPKEAKTIISNVKNSDFLGTLKSHSKELGLNFGDSLFPEEVLVAILKSEMQKFSPSEEVNTTWDESTRSALSAFSEYTKEKLMTDETPPAIAEAISDKVSIPMEEILNFIQEQRKGLIFGKFQEIIKYSKMDDSSVKKIAQETGCERKDVEDLIRIKTFEIILLMQQSLIATPTHFVIMPLMEFQNPQAFNAPMMPPNSEDRVFSFSEDFQSMELAMDWSIRLARQQYEAEKIPNTKEDAPVCATLDTTYTIPSIDDPLAEKPTVTAFKDLKVSWNITESFLDHLTGLIQPNLLEKGAEASLKNLHREIEEARLLVKASEFDTDRIPGLLNKARLISKEFILFANANLEEPKDTIAMGEALTENLVKLISILKKEEEAYLFNTSEKRKLANSLQEIDNLIGLVRGKTEEIRKK